jgi:hypothetical protein
MKNMLTTLECHSKGDKRYSAFYARLQCGRTVEDLYQSAKRNLQHQSIGKGQRPTFLVIGGKELLCDSDLRHEFYLMLWYLYFVENPLLLVEARGYSGFRDQFAWSGEAITALGNYPGEAGSLHLHDGCNQAAAIARLVGSMDVEWSTEISAAIANYRCRYL